MNKLSQVEVGMSADQKIVALADEYIPLADAYDAAWKAFAATDPGDEEALNRFGAENDTRSDRMDEIEAAIIDMIATTIPGFAAKAAIGMQVLQTHHANGGELDPTFDIVSNLCRELMAAAGRNE
jgi:hypothetical protein